VDTSKAYLTLSMSTAESMLISLGYRRLLTVQSETEHERQSKIHHFWVIYWIYTKSSVCFRHAPVIRDYDITVLVISHEYGTPPSFVNIFRYRLLVGSHSVT